MDNIANKARRPFALSAWQIGGAFFIYTLLTGLVVQLILLPYVFPAWHAGNGLLVGLDSVNFHKIAAQLANQIRAEGWSAWELAPKNQPVAGMAAIFYVLITPKPWVVLPLNALLHAIAALALYRLVLSLTKNWKISLLATLPFVLFPSSLTWTAQMHNDSYAIAGQLLFFYGWFLLAQRESVLSTRTMGWAALSILIGTILTWLVRDYLIQILQVLTLVVAIPLSLAYLWWTRRGQMHWRRTALALLVIWSLVVTIGFFATPKKVIRAERTAPRLQYEWRASSWLPRAVMQYEWLPAAINRQLFALSVTREINIRAWAGAGSNIDTDIHFRSASDIFLYLPRALQIGFLAPFPRDWFGNGSRAPNTMMRRVSGIEMSMVYLALLGLPMVLWRRRRELHLWVVVFYAAGMQTIYTLVTVNVGTLYRFRYGYLMTFVALGIAGWTVLWPIIQNNVVRFREKGKYSTTKKRSAASWQSVPANFVRAALTASAGRKPVLHLSPLPAGGDQNSQNM